MAAKMERLEAIMEKKLNRLYSKKLWAPEEIPVKYEDKITDKAKQSFEKLSSKTDTKAK